jgi:hypothetical protein
MSDYYATFSMATLAKLLDRAAGGSAEHRAIQEELRRRAINSAPDTETHLLFTAEEWSRTLQRNVAKLGRAPGSGEVFGVFAGNACSPLGPKGNAIFRG